MSKITNSLSVDDCKIIGEHSQYGAIVKCKTVHLNNVYVSRDEYKSGATLIHAFDRGGNLLFNVAAQIDQLIHRECLALDGNKWSEAAQLFLSMKSAGYKVSRYPASYVAMIRLEARGYQPYIECAGEFVPHRLGLVYAKKQALPEDR